MSPTAPAAAAPAAGGDARALPPAASGDGSFSTKFAASKQADNSVELFEKEWNLYQKVLHGNYLCHAGLYTAVTAHFQQLAAAAPPPPRRALRILDLGCGDAHCISGALAASGLGPRVARYTGVDMSSAAVSIARGNVTAALAAPSAPAAAAGAAAVVEFVETDMLGFLESLAPGSYDLVFASLAAHHLPDEQKGELVGLVARALAPGGQFLLVDIFFAPGDTRDSYFERFAADVAGGYETLTQEEKGAVLHHATNFDYPWHLSHLNKWAAGGAAAGGESAAGAGGGAPFAQGVTVAYEEKFFKTVLLQK